MVWSQLEPTGPHLTILVMSSFLTLYALFSSFTRNRLHLSEPPLAVLVGILFGPSGLNVLRPQEWGMGDDFTQEFTRIVLGIQCFAVGLELPEGFFNRRWKSVAMLLGPVMTFGWLVCALFIWLIFDTGLPTALTISACLTPTDPVLAASIVSDSQFSERVPARIRQLLSAESGSNDGISFPFLYVGLAVLTGATAGDTLKRWFLITILWQCLLGTLIGFVIGDLAHRLLRYSDQKSMVGHASYLVFYLLLALFCIGVASCLGVDDFLVAFCAGVAFSRQGWFAERTAQSKLPNIIDLQLNSSTFVYFGACIPWADFNGAKDPYLTLGRLFGFLALVLVFRRLPAVLGLKPFIPALKTYREALFAGHFGPMGVGALFLAIEARAQLETDTSLPLPRPPNDLPGTSQRAVDLIWPIICFVVLGSTVVHGLSTLVISVSGHFTRKEGERAPLIGGETETLAHMASDDEI